MDPYICQSDCTFPHAIGSQYQSQSQNAPSFLKLWGCDDDDDDDGEPVGPQTAESLKSTWSTRHAGASLSLPQHGTNPISNLREHECETRSQSTVIFGAQPSLKESAMLNLQRIPYDVRPNPNSSIEIHLACCNSSVDLYTVLRILQVDIASAARSVPLKSIKPIWNPVYNVVQPKFVKETYTFPLNLAIKNRADPDIIEILLSVAPSVLVTKDGPREEYPISILLKHAPHDISTVNKILLRCPQSAGSMDRYGNTPLHVACMHGASMEIVRRLYLLCPQSLKRMNFHGKTPLDIARQQTCTCPESVALYLLQRP